MSRNCFWHSYNRIQQHEASTCHQKMESSSDNRLDGQVKINSNNKKRTKKPVLKKLIVDEAMA